MIDTDDYSEEEWRPIPGASRWMVSDRGSVSSPHRILKPKANPSGHLMVTIRWDDGRRANVYVHRLVLLAFVGPPEPGHLARHLDGVPANNRLVNLRWGTRSENAIDRFGAQPVDRIEALEARVERLEEMMRKVGHRLNL